MKELIKIVQSLREDEPFEPKYWVEIYHNWSDYYEDGIEWGAALIRGEDRDSILERHNFFGKTPMEALKKLKKFLSTPNK